MLVASVRVARERYADLRAVGVEEFDLSELMPSTDGPRTPLNMNEYVSLIGISGGGGGENGGDRVQAAAAAAIAATGLQATAVATACTSDRRRPPTRRRSKMCRSP